MKTAEKIMEALPLGGRDAARLVLEVCEELGERVAGLEGRSLICLLRRVMRLGVEELAKREHTVSFETAVWASVEARAERRPTTRRDLRHYARRLLRVEGVASRPLRAMSTRECRELLQAAFGGSASSFRKGRAMLHSIFAYGMRQEWCAENPVARVEVPRVQEREIVPLCPEEVKRLETAVQQPEHRAMRFSLYLLLYCGLRPQEVERLRLQDVHPERGCVVVPGRCSKTGGGRVVPLRKCAELRGVPLRIPRNWGNRWRRLRRAAGFSAGQWVPDVCRHTFASYHAARFRDLGALQLEMGHRSADLLRSRYLNLPQVVDAGRFWRARVD
ncbi:MAG: tyrosine-type recombinase/integrase [Akkermansia sp.]|nr:tyrosine-type recombinase/integrase [Akkermansia sp.]